VSRQTAPGDVTKLPLDRVRRPRRRWRIPRHRRRTTTAAAAAAASSSRRSDDCLHVGYMTHAPRDAPFIAQQHGQTPDTRLYRGKPLKNLGPLCTPFCRARLHRFRIANAQPPLRRFVVDLLRNLLHNKFTTFELAEGN